jgi:hypothetical protein
MAFAAPRRTPEPGQLTDAWVPNEADFSAADAAAILDMERALHHLRVAELNPQARFWHQKPLETTDTFGPAMHAPWGLRPSVAPPPVRRHRQAPEWNTSIHTRSRSFASQAAAADVADRLRKESFTQLRTHDPQTFLPQPQPCCPTHADTSQAATLERPTDQSLYTEDQRRTPQDARRTAETE